MEKLSQRAQAEELQRVEQQGLGRPIISTLVNGVRCVAVGDKVFSSPRWKSFHDFLHDYVKSLIENQWANEELKKPQEERHPLLVWYEMTVRHQNQYIREPGRIATAPMTGAGAAYLGLAYNLYLTAHNVEVQQTLLRRLMKKDQFYGAYYEAYVVGLLIRAGFDIEFENEADVTTSHCELTATFRKTGKKFSVEAKMRGANKKSADIGNQLYAALKKRAEHTRVIFIEVNLPDNCDNATATANLSPPATPAAPTISSPPMVLPRPSSCNSKWKNYRKFSTAACGTRPLRRPMRRNYANPSRRPRCRRNRWRLRITGSAA